MDVVITTVVAEDEVAEMAHHVTTPPTDGTTTREDKKATEIEVEAQLERDCIIVIIPNTVSEVGAMLIGTNLTRMLYRIMPPRGTKLPNSADHFLREHDEDNSQAW